MISIAIVEDEKQQSDILEGYVRQYAADHGQSYNVSLFKSRHEFMSCRDSFDIVFLDIELPDGNGMEIAHEMRDAGSRALIIFVTNLAQYAIKGYEVRAFDFIVKPLSYYNFILKFSGALNCLETTRDLHIWIKDKSGMRSLNSSDILFVEVVKHYITYHMVDGSEYTLLGSFAKVCETLASAPFALCNRCYLVNLRHVTGVHQNTVNLGKTQLLVSRNRRADFIKRLNEFLVSGGVVGGT